MNKLIYLASPYSHPDPAVREARFKEVCEIAGRLMQEGHLVFSPIAHTHPIAVLCDLPKGFDFWEKYDKRILESCDELWIAVMDGFKKSKGVLAEVNIARRLGKPVRLYMPLLNGFSETALEEVFESGLEEVV